MKYFLLLPAVILDAVQFMFTIVFLALQFTTPVGGAVGGGLTGALFCWNMSTGIISGVLNAAQCAVAGSLLGTALTTFAVPIGQAIDVALSITVGAGILLLLAYNRMFYTRIVIPRVLGEALPFFGTLPIWTNLVWKSLREHQKREGAAKTSSARTPQVQTQDVTARPQMSDIRTSRPANDNTRSRQAYAA